MTFSTIFFSGEDQLAEVLAFRCVKCSLPNFHFHSMRPRQGGRSGVEAQLASYFKTSRSVPVLVMLDLDNETCAPTLRSTLLTMVKAKAVPSKMVLSIVKRESESWVIADAPRLSKFLDIDVKIIPSDPEKLDDPKGAVVKLAKHSRHYNKEICPLPGNKVGPGYNDVMEDFIRNHWRPEVAARNCPSLSRMLDRLTSLKEN